MSVAAAVETKTRVAIALSGGVSSAVAAALLKSEGYDVFGVYLRTHDERIPRICTSDAGEAAAREVARKLEIPIHVEPVAEEFEAKVIDPFVHARIQAMRSSACAGCMREVLFPALVRVAQASRCTMIATGHRASAALDPATGRGRLFRALERENDQSFWLYGVSPETASRLILPIGGIPSSMVKKLAIQFDLNIPPGEKTGRLGGCFEGAETGARIVESRAPSNFRARGPVRSVDGSLVGDHPGLFAFSVGDLYFEAKPGSDQTSLYVVGVETQANAVIVGTEAQLVRQEILAQQARWIRPVIGMKGLKCLASFGPQNEPVPCQVTHFEAGVVRVKLERPVRAPQAGRAIVFYEDNEVLGGAIIERTYP